MPTSSWKSWRGVCLLDSLGIALSGADEVDEGMAERAVADTRPFSGSVASVAML